MENINQPTSVQLLDTMTKTTSTTTMPLMTAPSNEQTPGNILSDTINMSSGSHLEQQQSLVRQKEAELKEMQNQIESYNQMVTQLTSQREMAVKRLADMDIQIQEMSKMLEVERLTVEAKDQELKSRRTKLQTLKNEEDELMGKFKSTKQELDVTTDGLTNTQNIESQVRNKITELKQFLAKTNSTLDDIEKAITYKDTIKLSALCEQPLEPPTPLATNSLLTNGVKLQDATSGLYGATAGSGQQQDPFGQDSTVDPFADNDPFDSEDNLFGFEAERPLPIPQDDPFAPKNDAF